MKIGIGITTTPGRKELFGVVLKQWEKYRPENSQIVYFEDVNYDGIARAKNKCLQALYEAGCDYFFLADDDCYPVKERWWFPYIESGEHHLMYQFDLPGKPLKELHRDSHVVAYDKTRGCMLFVTRKVLDTVGGFNEGYGIAGFEHPDYTTRIHNAGLTSHRAMDVVGSNQLFYCFDQDNAIESSIPKGVRGNSRLYNKSKNSREYMEFRT